MEPQIAELPAPQADERTMAMLAHVLQFVSGFLGPLIILAVKRDSRFVTFHAIQALLWQVVYVGVAMLSMAAWLAVIFSFAITQSGSASSQRMGLPFLIVLPVLIVVWGGGWLTTMVLCIVYGIKANNGEWAAYPIVGNWARKLARV